MRAVRFAAMVAVWCWMARAAAASAPAPEEDWPAALAKSAGHAVVTVIASGDTEENSSQGSGFLASADGLVVTNYHVIRGMKEAIIGLDNGSFLEVTGVVRKSLPLTDQDLVVLKCEGRNLPFLELAAGDDVTSGQAVVAMGTPMGLEATLSTGVVSAVRDLNGARVVQTTAPISEGSSGGPLFRRDGKVIGVTSAFLSEGQNLNFAVAIGRLRTVLAGLDDAAKQDTVALGDVTKALAGKAAPGGDADSNPAWAPPADGFDIFARLVALDRASVPASNEQLAGLAGLGVVKVVAEELPAAVKATGVTDSYLKSYVELAIRKSSVLQTSEVQPYLYINLCGVDSGDGWVAYNLELELNRPAILTLPTTLEADGKAIWAMAPIWTRGLTGHCMGSDLQRDVTAALDRWMVELFNDVRKANPPEKEEKE